MTIQEIIGTVFLQLQNLQIQPTEHNVNLLSSALQELKEAHVKADEMQGKIAKMEQEIKRLKGDAAMEETDTARDAAKGGTHAGQGGTNAADAAGTDPAAADEMADLFGELGEE